MEGTAISKFNTRNYKAKRNRQQQSSASSAISFAGGIPSGERVTTEGSSRVFFLNFVRLPVPFFFVNLFTAHYTFLLARGKMVSEE